MRLADEVKVWWYSGLGIVNSDEHMFDHNQCVLGEIVLDIKLAINNAIST